VQLCQSEECLSGTDIYICTPALPSLYDGNLRIPSDLGNRSFGAVRVVFCSAHGGVRFKGNDARYENIVTTTTTMIPGGNYNAVAVTDHDVLIPTVPNNAALCETDIDCVGNVSQPICNHASPISPRCVTVQKFLGQCGSPCHLKRTGYRCWCHSVNRKFLYTAGVVGLCLLTYILLYCRIRRAKILALQKNAWGLRNSLLPLYRTCFQFLGIYLLATVSLRLVLALDDDFLHVVGIPAGWYVEGSPINIFLRSLVAFLEETMLESVVFFFLQYGSGMDQGYRAVAGGVVCGVLYASLTALQHVPLPYKFADLTPTGTCIGCLLDREGVGYRRPYSSFCWMQLFRSGVYQCSSVVLYVFLVGQRRYESIIVAKGGWFRCCCQCLLRDSRSRRGTTAVRRPDAYYDTMAGVGIQQSLLGSVQSGAHSHTDSIVSGSVLSSARHQGNNDSTFLRRKNAHFDRFLVLLIALRVLDMSYMLSGIGSCTVLLGSFMWMVWLQIEVYFLFLSDTLYWKNYMNDLVERSQSEMTQRRSEMTGGGNGVVSEGGGVVDGGGSMVVGPGGGGRGGGVGSGSGGGGGGGNSVVFSVVGASRLANTAVGLSSSSTSANADSLYDSQHLLLSPAASHWVKPRGTEMSLRYHNPPTRSGGGNYSVGGGSTDDSIFYRRSGTSGSGSTNTNLRTTNKIGGGSQTKLNGHRKRGGRRPLGGGVTVAENFNEEAAVRL
jgi:hypothetical protein